MVSVQEDLDEMKIIVCDDNKREAQENKSLLETNKELIGADIEIRTPNDFRISLEEDILKCDIVVMDVEFVGEDYDGIKLVEMINEKLPACQVIFLTNYLEFATEVYETKHCYFVVKANANIMLERAIHKAVTLWKEETKQQYLEIAHNGKKKQISISSIVYMEKIQRKVYIHTEQEVYESYDSLNKLAKASQTFLKCHGSYAVNMNAIETMSRDSIELTGGITVPIGRTYQEVCKELYLQYWSKRM